MDKRSSQAMSIQLSTQSLARVGPSGRRTLWAMAKMFGNSVTRKGSLVIENSFPNPFGINEPEPSSEATAEETSESDPGKSVPVVRMLEEKIPPCDEGHRAWACLLGAATIEGLMWGKDLLSTPSLDSDTNTGFPMTFGVFQSYFQTHPPFENNRYIPVVGVLATVCPA